MKIKINFTTGNWFNDGTFEVGRVQEEEVFTRKDIDDILDEIPEGTEYFITDADGNALDIYEFCNQLILIGKETTVKTYNISTTNANIKVTEEDIRDILCSAIEGGIGYWACLDNTTEEFKDAPKDEPYSETCAKILLNGGVILLADEDGDYWLSLERLLIGIENWFKSGGDKYGAVCIDGTLDCGSIDAECADAIIQFALFGDIVYR